MKYSIPIFLYHHVSPDREMTPQALEAQLSFLLSEGYQSLSLDEILAVCAGERPLERPSFGVTFDDGYLDNWLYAFPVLEKLRVQAAYYLVTEYVEEVAPRLAEKAYDSRHGEREKGRFLSWEEARRMADSGLVSFGSHTETHRHFKRKERYVDLRQELLGSKKKIDKQLGKSCSHFAWPWGDFQTEWRPLVGECGYRTAVTTLAGANAVGSDPLLLHRLNVSRPTVEWLKSRLAWNHAAWSAAGVGFFYGWDRRLKTWIQKESPYAHG
jgi:peptidoglycan/xylan/chitin deacetylase (PgdA/CDA1 family)